MPSVPIAEVAGTWEALGDARLRLGQFEHAAAAYRETRTGSPGDAIEDARLIQKEAFARLRLAQFPVALRRLTAAIRVLDGVDGDAAAAQRARLYSAYGAVLQHQHRPHLAIEWCEKAMAEAGDGIDARDALAHAYRILDWAFVVLGRLEDAVYSKRAAQIYEEIGDLDRLAWTVNNLGGFAFLAGRWNEALAHYESARETWKKIGDETSASVAEFNIAHILSEQGRTEEAIPLLQRVLDVQQAAGNPIDIGQTESALGRLVARAGSFGEARELFDRARSLFVEEGDALEVLTTDSRLVESLVLQGESGTALQLAAEAIESAQEVEGVSLQLAMLRRLRGWALMQSVALAAAHDELQESLRLARSGDSNFGAESADYDAALTLDALARLGQLTGENTEAYEEERDAILERLGVLATPSPPLGAAGDDS